MKAEIRGGLTMAYQNAVFYSFSGTGNTLRASKWASEKAIQAGIDTKTVNLMQAKPDIEIGEGENNLVGVLTPAHGFTAPWAVLLFALRLPRRKGTHAFVVSTRAGMKIGKLFVPGMEGTAAYIIALIMALKGYRIRGILGLDMPTNWTALHPGMSEGSARAIIERAKPRMDDFTETILTSNRWFRFGGFVCLALGILLLQASIGYLIYARIPLAKTFYPNYRCNGCGICADSCPCHAITMWGKKSPKPFWTYKCESCMRCMNFCPISAVEAAQSWTVLAFYIGHIPIGIHLLSRVLNQGLNLRLNAASIPMHLGNYGWFLTSVFALYIVLVILARIPIINRALQFLTLTTIYRRYHEPDTKLSDFR